jgi:hypothetical protein
LYVVVNEDSLIVRAEVKKACLSHGQPAVLRGARERCALRVDVGKPISIGTASVISMLVRILDEWTSSDLVKIAHLAVRARCKRKARHTEPADWVSV